LKSVYWVIGRIGGFDGVSIQAFEFMKLLNKLDIKFNIVTGLEETEFGDINYSENKSFLVEGLNFKHENSKFLYRNSFISKEDGSSDKWFEVFEKHKSEISDGVDKVLSEDEEAPVFIHNLLSLRHLHPAAASAIMELIEKYPKRKFISFAPDSDWERSLTVKKIREDVKEFLYPGLDDFSSPFVHGNVYHLVLNNYQREVFNKVYKIPFEKIFTIPDFLEFKSSEIDLSHPYKKDFLDYLGKNSAYLKDNEIQYRKRKVDEDTVFFLCPVRPVQRKKLRAAIFLAHQFNLKEKKDVSVILTHPNEDIVLIHPKEENNQDYLKECIEFANNLRINLIFLGDSLKLSKQEGAKDVWTLDDVYENMASLNSLGMITSSSGGWENAINELLKTGIPILVNPELKSYAQIKDNMHIDVLGLPLKMCYKLIKDFDVKILADFDVKDILEISKFVSWVKKYGFANADDRINLVKHNYKQAYINLSSESSKKQVLKLLEAVF